MKYYHLSLALSVIIIEVETKKIKILKSQARTGGFFEDGSRLICSLCGEDMMCDGENFGSLSCECGNVLGNQKMLNSQNSIKEFRVEL